MNMDKVAKFDYVPDNFEAGEHDGLDAAMNRRFSFNPDDPEDLRIMMPVILSSVVKASAGHLNKKYSSIDECEELINSYPGIKTMILNGPKNGYKELRLLKLLQKEPVLKYDEQFVGLPTAAEHGWEDPYVGDSADALWEHIQEWFDKDPQSDPDQRPYYAKYTAIVQSSGMGKSRTVDEMSKSHFVIPVNLKDPKSSGYPPTDIPAFRYLTGSPTTQRDAFLRSCAFLHALFLETAGVLGAINEHPAQSFRENMKQGMTHISHGEPRVKFYEAVVAHAKELQKTEYATYFTNDTLSPSDSKEDRLLLDEKLPLRDAFQTLCKALQFGDTSKKPSKRRRKVKGPSVIIAFDEVHTLTKLYDHDENPWSRFGEIRRAIRGLKDELLFTLFLSTSGTLFSVTPTPSHDWSARMIHRTDVILPFYALGFDSLAVLVDFSKIVLLSRVTSEDHLSSYGRPLWTSYYRSQGINEIVPFGVVKLLGGVSHHFQDLLPAQKLACLSHRLPIEFLTAHYASQVSDAEKEQVNSHMRVILKVTDSLETIITTSPSEPVLSEAAYFLINRKANFNPPAALKTILSGFAVHKGDLGELLVALLFIMARDKAVGPPKDNGAPSSGHRWCNLTELLGSLFVAPAHHGNILGPTSHGWSFTTTNTKALKSTLAETFKDSKVYFTHFIKASQHAVIEVEFLMHLMVRGAAILCANGQPNIDGIIPFLLEGDEIRPDNIGVIMFQVKNDINYTSTAQPVLLRNMDPRSSGVISDSASVPIIRFFFALAAGSPTVQAIHHQSSCTVASNYSAYDFWISGLSPQVLQPVVDDPHTWQDILQASHRWEQLYSAGSDRTRRILKSQNPGTANGEDFWKRWCKKVPKRRVKASVLANHPLICAISPSDECLMAGSC